MDGQRIKNLRLQSGISQEELAKKLWVSRDLVSKWETNKRRPSYEMVEAMSLIFDVNPEDIAPLNDTLIDELNLCIPNDCILTSLQIEAELNSFLTILTPRERNIFISRYYYFNDISEICQQYKISKNYVRVILHRNRKKLKKHFEEVSK